MNHITLETAKKLKEIGWELPTLFIWIEYKGNQRVEHLKVFAYGTATGADATRLCAAPTCEELLEVLPYLYAFPSRDGNAKETAQLALRKYGDKYTATYLLPDRLGHAGPSGYSDNIPAEALALLLIELVDQGIVSKDSLTYKK